MTPFTFERHIAWGERIVSELEAELGKHQDDEGGIVALGKQVRATKEHLADMRSVYESLKSKRKLPDRTIKKMDALVTLLTKHEKGLAVLQPGNERRDFYVFECTINDAEQFVTNSPDSASLPADLAREGGRLVLVDAFDRDSIDARQAAEIDADIEQRGYHSSMYGVTTG